MGMAMEIFSKQPGVGNWRYGWIVHERHFLCTRQNLTHRDRRGLFSIHTKYGLLNRRPKEVGFFNFD
jgi:hypothetical protein